MKTHLQRGLAALEARLSERVARRERRSRTACAVALHDGADSVHESPDLFARVELSIEDDRRLRVQHRALVGIGLCIAAAAASIVVAVVDRQQGELLMDWWILEIITTAVLVAIAFWLGPLIKRFGRSYAADVFRGNPAPARASSCSPTSPTT